MPEPVDPWRRPHRPRAGGATAGPATKTADPPGGHIPLPTVPVAAGWARRRGIELLRDRGLSPGTVDVVSLLITELVTNALLHGLSATARTEPPTRCAHCGGQICLNLREEPGAVLIEVFDTALLPPRRRRERPLGRPVFGQAAFAAPRFTEAGFETAGFETAGFETAGFETAAFEEPLFGDAECGRGLLLVSNLSEEQGYYLPPAGGKVVWCVVKAAV